MSHAGLLAASKPNLPTGLQFHSDEPQLVAAFNSGQPLDTISSATLSLIFKSFSTQPEILSVPFARSLRFIESGTSVCITDKIKTPERADKYLFSLPMSFYQAQRLYQLQTLPPISKRWLNEKGEIRRVSQVLKVHPNARILLPEHYSFGERLDKDLNNINPEQVVVTASDIYSSYLDMFEAQRAEFTILFPAAVYERFGERLPKARSYNIEQASEYITGRFLCSNTAAGKQFIQLMNQVLRTLYGTQEYAEAHTRYLNSDDIPEVTRFIQHFAETLNKLDE